MKILFIEPPPSLDWTPQSKVRIGGRRHPAETKTGEQVYQYLNLSAAAIARRWSYEPFYLHCQTQDIDITGVHSYMKVVQPDMVVIYSQHITLEVERVICHYCKEMNIQSVAVGAYATAMKHELVKTYDVVAYGEYDLTITDIAKHQEHLDKVDGIAYANKVTKPRKLVQDLDKLPIPAYDLIDLKLFKETVNLRLPVANLITSRGCPYQCIFCTYPNTIYSHQYRTQSPDRVVAEALYLKDRFKVKELRYDDDIFEVDRKRVFDICHNFKKERLDMTWSQQSRAELMRKDLVERMAESGCVRLLFGTESGSDYILNKINKGTTVRKMEQGLKNVKDVGIMRHNCYMIGWPWETNKTAKQTLLWSYKVNSEFAQFTKPIPLPGTPFSQMKELKDREQSFSDETQKYYRKYYLRSKYIKMMLKLGTRNLDYSRLVARLIKAYMRR